MSGRRSPCRTSSRNSRAALKGPITTPVGTGLRIVNVALRQELDLFATDEVAGALVRALSPQAVADALRAEGRAGYAASGRLR